MLQQQNMLNVHHMHTWVCTMFKWNYEQHLYTHTLIPIINRFASTNEPLNCNIFLKIFIEGFMKMGMTFLYKIEKKRKYTVRIQATLDKRYRHSIRITCKLIFFEEFSDSSVRDLTVLRCCAICITDLPSDIWLSGPPNLL